MTVQNFSAFSSALAATAAHVITPKKFIYNIVTENNFESLYWLLLGRPMSDMLRAGSDIRARVKFKASSKAAWYNVASDEHSPQISEDGTWLIAQWFAHMAQESWKEEELLINAGGTTQGDLAEETWTQEIFSKLQSLVTSLHSSISASMWQMPDQTIMGGTDGLQPYSIPVYVNEMTNGIFNGGTSGQGAFGAIHGLTVTDPRYTKYKPYQGTYGATSGSVLGFIPAPLAGSNVNLIFALNKAIKKTGFRPPPVNQEYFDKADETMIDQSGGAIFCSADGQARAEHLFVSSQTRWDNPHDPSGAVYFKKTPIVYESQLDNAPLYAVSTTSTAAEGSATITGPRYYGINAKRMTMYFHKNRFLKFLEPFRENATLYTQHVNTLGTMLCVDRSKHFIISPAVSN